MADKNIGALPAATALNDDSLLIAEQQGQAVHFRGKLLKDYARQGVDSLVASAVVAAEQAAKAADEAKAAADSVQDVVADTEAAKQAAQAAENARAAAVLAAQAAEQAAALAAQQAAADVEGRLQGYVEDAEQAKVGAEAAAGNAATEAVRQAEATLSGYVSDAESAKDAAQGAAGSAAQDAVAAVDTEMAQYVLAAQAAQRAAEQARDEAQEVAGGNFATPAYVDEKTKTAEDNAKAYTDEKLENVDFDITADEVKFSDGETFQDKYNSGELTGPPGYTPQKDVDYFDGKPGVGIESVEQTTTSTENGGENIVTVKKTDGTTSTFSVRNGGKGDPGTPGSPGSPGTPGANATINGVTTLVIEADAPITTRMEGNTLYIGLSGDLPSAAEAYTVTLLASGWMTGADGRYQQTVAAVGVTTDPAQVIQVDVSLTGEDTAADAEAQGAWGPDDGTGPSSNNIKQGNGTLTFYCTAVPTINIPVAVGVH